jgi:hypothetical protein
MVVVRRQVPGVAALAPVDVRTRKSNAITHDAVADLRIGCLSSGVGPRPYDRNARPFKPFYAAADAEGLPSVRVGGTIAS